MALNIIAAGVIKDADLENILHYYTKQIKNFKLNTVEINCKNLDNLTANQKIIASTLKFNESYNILLDETGDQYTTLKFLELITEKIKNYKNINFLIGPNEGFNEHSKGAADKLIGLSKFTLPHKLARLILVEQIYRIDSLMSNSPYHKI